MAKKRILVSISPELEAALDALAEATSAAKASIAGELLEQSLPAIVQMAKIHFTRRSPTIKVANINVAVCPEKKRSFRKGVAPG